MSKGQTKQQVVVTPVTQSEVYANINAASSGKLLFTSANN